MELEFQIAAIESAQRSVEDLKRAALMARIEEIRIQKRFLEEKRALKEAEANILLESAEKIKVRYHVESLRGLEWYTKVIVGADIVATTPEIVLHEIVSAEKIVSVSFGDFTVSLSLDGQSLQVMGGNRLANGANHPHVSHWKPCFGRLGYPEDDLDYVGILNAVRSVLETYNNLSAYAQLSQFAPELYPAPTPAPTTAPVPVEETGEVTETCECCGDSYPEGESCADCFECEICGGCDGNCGICECPRCSRCGEKFKSLHCNRCNRCEECSNQ